MNVLITGCSSGLGYELAKRHIEFGDHVYGISRSSMNLELSNFLQVDFKQSKSSSLIREEPFLRYKNFNRVYLNAGTLGELKPVNKVDPLDLFSTLRINVLGNKIVLDTVLEESDVEEVIWTSSGAAEKAYDGLSLYCLSKAMNIQLARCYQAEFKGVDFYCMNPGPFKSKMQEELRRGDSELFSSLKRFKDQAELFPTAEVVSKRILEVLSKNLKLPLNIVLDKYTST
jgi:NADP-dependent 3-hydroxy acid dehydrogenase YdfG